jgi:hypothetical protein
MNTGAVVLQSKFEIVDKAFWHAPVRQDYFSVIEINLSYGISQR